MATLGTQVAIVQSNQILLIQRRDFEMWGLPGGSIDPGESAAQAAVREAYEETGLEVELTGLVGLYAMPQMEALGLDTHVVVFRARVTGGELKSQTAETLDAQFYYGDQLPEALMWHHRTRIEDALSVVGGSVARLLRFDVTLPENISRQELYRLRDESGLSKHEFFLKHLNNPREEKLEVGEPPKSRLI